jgi:hypothetical protein
MHSAEFYREQAERCRRLAREVLDRVLQRRLLEIAEEFDTKAESVGGTECREPERE